MFQVLQKNYSTVSPQLLVALFISISTPMNNYTTLDELFHHVGNSRRYGTFRKDQVDGLLSRFRQITSPNLSEEVAQMAKRVFIAKEAASVQAIVKVSFGVTQLLFRANIVNSILGKSIFGYTPIMK
jgi:hypothetical protein